MKYVIGMFDDLGQAELAERKVAGLAKVERLSGHGSNAYTTLQKYGVKGTDLDGFCEGIRRGATLICAHTDDANATRVAEMFRGSPSVDLTRRTERWRSQGWSGYDPKAPALASTDIEREREFGRNELHVPIIQETIAVGKREVDRGGVRVETHMVETPVQEQVALRDEQVRVERHAVNRPVGAGDEMGDRVVEMRARGEEAVVAKQARVVEEVIVKKEGATHQETIRDTVKRTEVDVKQLATERTDRASRPSHP